MNRARGQLSPVWVLTFLAVKPQSILSDTTIREQSLLAAGLKLLTCS